MGSMFFAGLGSSPGEDTCIFTSRKKILQFEDNQESYSSKSPTNANFSPTNAEK